MSNVPGNANDSDTADRRFLADRLLDELRVQSNFDAAAQVARVDGRMRAPGIPLEPGMRIRREREAERLRKLSERMEEDLSALALQEAKSGGDAQSSETIATGRSMLGELQSGRPVGRLAMDLENVLAVEPGSDQDVVLQDGDVLMVPGPMQSVTVLGEVQSPTSLLFDESLGQDEYINLSGGMTRRADADRVYIVRANGQVSANGSRKWFRASDADVQPGDTIVVPTDIERMRPLPLWSAVTSIIYNMAVAVAAVNSF